MEFSLPFHREIYFTSAFFDFVAVFVESVHGFPSLALPKDGSYPGKALNAGKLFSGAVTPLILR
jgi:hypothetical protein